MNLITRSCALSLMFIAFLGFYASPADAAQKRIVRTTEATPAASASSAHGPFGLGVLLGDPTAITGKYWTQPDRAIDFGVSFFTSQFFLLYADYLFHFPGAFGNSSRFVSELSPYVGVGGMLVLFSGDYYSDGKYYRPRNSSSTGLGVRIPLGIEWELPRAPLGVFVEIVPGILVIPGTQAFVQAGVGIRYYF